MMVHIICDAQGLIYILIHAHLYDCAYNWWGVGFAYPVRVFGDGVGTWPGGPGVGRGEPLRLGGGGGRMIMYMSYNE